MAFTLALGCALLRELLLSDTPSLARHANDRRVWIQLRDIFPHPYQEKDAAEFIERIQLQNQPTAFALAVDGQAVGVIGLTRQTDINRQSAEIGYWIGTAHWGKGIATAAVRALTSWSMEELGLVRLYATPCVHNVACWKRRVMFERVSCARARSRMGASSIKCCMPMLAEPIMRDA